MQQSQQDYIHYQSDALILKLGRFVWAAQAVSAVLLMSLLFAFSDLRPLMMWTGWMIVLTFSQGIICHRGAYLANHRRPLRRWPLAFDVSVICIAISWTYFSFALVPVTASEIRNFVGFLLGGAILIYIGTQYLHYRVVAFSVTLIVISRSARLVMDSEGPLGPYAAVMQFIFLGIMLSLGWMLRDFMMKGFALQWEKTALAARLEEQTESIKQARREAEAANEAKSVFLAQASHDLRQPLHAMGLHMASLSGEPLSPKTSAVITRISQSVEVLSKLFNSLLDVTLLDTRQLAPKPVAFDASALIKGIADEYAIAAQGENMEVIARSDAVFIRSDPLLVRRIIQNLVSNAIRHSEGGEVFIETERQQDGVVIKVRDTGQGIADAHKTHMFDDFFKGKSSQSGLGLGLAIVRRLIDALDIGIEIDTGKDTGTEFRFGPFEQTANVDDARPELPELPIYENGRVLVIDDDHATLEATGALLANWGWDVDARPRLKDADIASLEKTDMIISDYELAFGETGLEVIKAIRAAHGPIPALIITGSTMPEIRQKIADAGFILLHKPVMPVQLRSAILSLMDRA